MKMREYLKEATSRGLDLDSINPDYRDYAEAVFNFMGTLAQEIGDDASCEENPNEMSFEEWAMRADLDNDIIERCNYMGEKDYYEDEWGDVSGPRHADRIAEAAIRSYTQDNHNATSFTAQDFVEGVMKHFYELDKEQDDLYDDAYEICRKYYHGAIRNIYPYFDNYDPYSCVETYDYVDEDLIDKLIDRINSKLDYNS